MVASSSKQTTLSYAERAKRASSGPGLVTGRPPVTMVNGNAKSAAEPSLSSSSSKNNTPSSSVVLTRPGTPPTVAEPDIASQDTPESTNSTAKAPPPPNVWNTRKEQMAQRAAASQPPTPSRPKAPVQGPPTTSHPPSAGSAPMGMNSQIPSARLPVNGGSTSPSSHSAATSPAALKDMDDPFVVRMPRALQGSSAAEPPNISDAESWPVPSASNMAQNVEVDKKDTNPITQKKNEKTKWVLIPAAELQAAADAAVENHSSHSRSQSRHQQLRSPYKSHSRRPSHSRNTNQRGFDAAGPSGDVSAATSSRAESVAHSRVASVHSSPRNPRGRKLLEGEELPVLSVAGELAQTSNGGASTHPISIGQPVEVASILPAPQMEIIQPQPHIQRPFIDTNIQPTPPVRHPAHPPYSSNSPVYYPPPSAAPYGSSPMGDMYMPLPPNGGYLHAPPQPGQMYPSYPPYHYPHQPMQPQYAPYMYVPYGYPPPPPGQGHERQPSAMVSPYGFHPQPLPGEKEVIPQEFAHPEGQFRNVLPPTSPNLPPTSDRTRPLPPGESTAIAGYRTIQEVPVSPLLNASRATDQLPLLVPIPSGSTIAALSRVDHEPDMVFGSIGLPGGIKSPPPEPTSVSSYVPEAHSVGDVQLPQSPRLAMLRKTFTAFSIGVKPGEAGSSTVRRKLRPHRQGKNSEHKRFETAPGRVESSFDSVADIATSSLPVDKVEEVLVNVIDLTDPHTTLEFGTSGNVIEGVEIDASTSTPVEDAAVKQVVNGIVNEAQAPPPDATNFQPPHMQPYSPYPPSIPSPHTPVYPIQAPRLPIPSGSAQLPNPPPPPVPGQIHMGSALMAPLPSMPPQPGLSSSGPSPVGGDEWEVRDFGYGFGAASGTGYRLSAQEIDRERERERDYRGGDRRERDREYSDYIPGRNRRGSGSGFGGYYDGRGGYDRGSFGRRGRGGPNGFGGRGFFRGGFSGRGHNSAQRHQHQTHFNSQSSFQPAQHPLSPMSQSMQLQDTSNPYIISPVSATSYLQSPFGSFGPQFTASQPQTLPPPQQGNAPPFPEPITHLAFPLDSTRYYLLGQVEYYFSVQNLAQDLYLRRNMDSRGWIAIPLIASFNRVKQLTTEIQLLRDVLSLSSLVEVRDDHVRMSNGQWEQFVLPGAPETTVESVNAKSHADQRGPYDGEVEEDEEDEVEIVMEATT